MNASIKDQAEAKLAGTTSHLLVERGDKNLPGGLRNHLRQKGIAVEGETTLDDEQGRTWIVLSIPLADISQLVLELIEKGFSGNIQGINARSFRERS
ncbi:MAG: hypothetical protein HY892_04365 [Deltaproteobacteria bacterium]|nr:hypothetical protein [Deltaproteobacteria bacterium]